MIKERTNIQFCGFGGQGIILSAVIMGTTAVKCHHINAVQTQSYGSEARGGECQAELILSPNTINSPISESVDVLVAMSQTAYNTYIPRLKENGILYYDPDMVSFEPSSRRIEIPVPATKEAAALGNKIVANMYLLGFLQASAEWVGEKEILDVIREKVPADFVDLNIKAALLGMEAGKKAQVKTEYD